MSSVSAWRLKGNPSWDRCSRRVNVIFAKLVQLSTLTSPQLEDWVAHLQAAPPSGRLPDYIPLLAQADPAWFAVQIGRGGGADLAAGTVAQPFPLMSVIKPLLLLFLLQQWGQDPVFARVGMQPSDQTFHSLAQLTLDRGFPRNPMLNSGAIALAEMLPGGTGSDRCQALCDWLNQRAGSCLSLDEVMLTSVRSLPNEANRAIAKLLAQSGWLKDIELVLDTYNQICCLSGTVADLAKLGLLLAKPQEQIHPMHQQTVNALMLTCGLYEVSVFTGISHSAKTETPGDAAFHP